MQHTGLGPKDIKSLMCQKCDQVLGVPIVHYSGRLAFRLRLGMYKVVKDRKKPDDSLYFIDM